MFLLVSLLFLSLVIGMRKGARAGWCRAKREKSGCCVAYALRGCILLLWWLVVVEGVCLGLFVGRGDGSGSAGLG